MDAASSTKDEWIRRFAACLGELRSSVPDGEALEVAGLAFGSANDLAPEAAATVFAEILNARVPVHDLKRWMTREESPLRAGR